MDKQTDLNVDAGLESVARRRPISKICLDLMRKQPLGTFGLCIVLIMVGTAILADVLAPYDPVIENFDAMFQPPGGDNYILGTDEFGRDILSRLIHGSRTALMVGIICAFSGATIGLVIGVASAFLGGAFDLIVSRILDVFLAFPLIVLSLAVVATLGPGIQNVMLAIIVVKVPICARIVRANALAIREIPYVDAARALGFSNARIILRHMVPNVMAPYLIMLTSFVGEAILLEASLSFLGLGVQDPIPAWGLMLTNASEFFEGSPWLAIYPGLAISLSLFGFNLLGDAVRDVLDPKLRSR